MSLSTIISSVCFLFLAAFLHERGTALQDILNGEGIGIRNEWPIGSTGIQDYYYI